MANERLIARRELLRKSVLFGLAAAGAGALAACSKSQASLNCDDTVGMNPDDIQNRKTLAYVEKSTDPNKTCTNCQQFVAGPAADKCGTCKVLKGPVNPGGNCKSWLAKGSAAPSASSG
jgi:hypothetical protein